MEPAIDPTTGRPLPADAIQRILYITNKVHVYNIPPLTSNKGHMAASWTADGNKRQIFTARLRVLETATPNPRSPGDEIVRTDILLEDPSNGQLFAAAPYTTPAIVEQVLDSSRFFAIRVQGEGGRKATLGIGFEERTEAFDFSVALQEVRRTTGIDAATTNVQRGSGPAGRRGPTPPQVQAPQEKKDYSLKEGETITINIGGKGRRGTQPEKSNPVGGFSLPPPPGGGGGFSLPPPPSAQEVKAQRRLSKNTTPEPGSIQDMGFDDGEFGEFQ